MKRRIADAFPYYDTNALDSARFLYGNDSDEVEFYEGDKTILDYLKEDDFADFDASLEQVLEGQRNSTMSHIAGKIIKRYGNTENAYQIFLKKAELCNPPLPELIRRAGNLGRLDRKCKEHNKTVPTAFHFKPADLTFPGPFEQAEYIYSLIESEE